MRKGEALTHRQLMAVAFVSLLSPVIRLMPRSIVELGGRAAWTGVVLAVIPAMAFLLVMRGLTRHRAEGEGLAQIIIRAYGGVPGRVICCLVGVWIVFYAGVILRAGAERLLQTAYSGGSAAFFMAVTVAAALIAAVGRVQSLGRMSEILAVVFVAVLAVVVLFSLNGVKAENIWPVTWLDSERAVLSVLPVMNVVGVGGLFWFLGGHVKQEAGELKRSAAWMGILLALSAAIVVVCCGALSPELIRQMQNPFFIMTRNMSIFGIVERTESVVLGMWVLTDLVYLIALFKVDGEIFRAVTGRSWHRVGMVIMAAAVFFVGLAAAPDAFALQYLSQRFVPAVNMAFSLGLLPLTLAVLHLRKRNRHSR